MDLTRRTLLATGTALGLTGCLSSGDSNVSYPETATRTPPTETPAEAAMAEAEAEPTVDDEAGQQTEPSVPNSRLATEVGRAYGEIEWFASSYDASIRTYQRVLGNAMATVTRVRDAAEFDANSLGLVRRAVDRSVTTAEAELGGHFGIPGQMREETDHHLATIRRFADRGDLDRVDEELERLHDYLRGIRSDLFVRRVLSDRQVDAALYRHLHDGTVDSDDDEDDDEADPGLFECYHSTGYAGYAYAGPRYIERNPFGEAPGDDPNEGRELLARQRRHFDAAGESTGRNGYAYVVSYAIPDEADQPADLTPLDYPYTSLFVQQYDGVAAATDAVEALFDTSVSREGRYSFGRDRWHRVYYHADGDVTYAYLIQAGAYVLVAAPSEVAWEERVDWTEPLDRLWLWRP